jgi:DNA-binding SARP family transcriptional activator
VAENAPLTLGGPKQRALLALLLLRTNDVVAREALIDSLWGSEPPRSAVQSLQVYVHGLRQVLGADRIETRGSGYRLPVEERELDVARFERLLEHGSRALAAGRPADAADDLRAALALWRGSALADLGGEPVAGTEAPRLEDRRLTAHELLNDAQLALGQHEQLVPELERLIAAEPFRERFRAQQMLALYRAGARRRHWRPFVPHAKRSSTSSGSIRAPSCRTWNVAWAEISEFASAELGVERAEELRHEGAELMLDEFTARMR